METRSRTRRNDEASDEASEEPGSLPVLMPTRSTLPSSPSVQASLSREIHDFAESEMQGHRKAASRYIILIMVLLSHLCVTACVWLLPNPELNTRLRVLHSCYFTVGLICLLVFEAMRLDSSHFILQARAVMYLEWCITCANVCCDLVPRVSLAFHIFSAVKIAVCACLTYAAQLAVHARFELVEAASSLHLGSRYICYARAVSLVSGCVVSISWSLVALAYASGISLGVFAKVLHALSELAFTATCMTAWAVMAAITSWGFTHVCDLAHISADNILSKDSYAFAEWNWARRVFGRMRGATVLACGTQAGIKMWFFAHRLLCLAGVHAPWMEFRLLSLMIDMFQTISEFACFLAMVRFFRKYAPACHAPLRHDLRLLPEMSTQSTAFAEKVRELAERSIDVSMLLDFFDMLGTYHGTMPHYDPWRSTTNDVVRCSVIPLSRTPSGGGSAFVVRFAGSRRQSMPRTMVTHTWSSLFIDLVAAVVADALGLDAYESIVEELAERRTSDIRQCLTEANSLSQTYWICSFCVNQHASICGGFGAAPPADTAAYHRWKRNCHDSASGRMLPRCPCSERKFLNDRPDQCELNKFDDMMALLQREVSGFRQLVVVDRHLEVFSRLWCVAELVQAYMSGISQSVCMLSRDALDMDHDDFQIYWKLVTLDVAECTATREEDKAAILAKIPSEFNAQLQAAIFGERGFLGKHFIGFDELRAASLSVHRLRMAAACSSSGSESSEQSE